MGLFDIFKKKNPFKIDVNVSITESKPKLPTQAEFDAQVTPVDVRIKSAIANKHGLKKNSFITKTQLQ